MEQKKKLSNNVHRLREAVLMSKAEFARKANLSILTISRIESGYPCRLDTKRKIILALGLKLSDKSRVFFDDSNEATEEASNALERAGGK